MEVEPHAQRQGEAAQIDLAPLDDEVPQRIAVLGPVAVVVFAAVVIEVGARVVAAA